MHVPVAARSFNHNALRVAQADATHSPAPTGTDTSSDPPPPPISLSTSARSLVGTFSVVGAVFFAIIAWKLFNSRRRKKAAARSVRFSVVYGTQEKPAIVSFSDLKKDVYEPRKSVLSPQYGSYTGWVPQIKSVTLPSGVTVPPVAVTARDRSPKMQDDPPTPNSGPSVSPVPSPPPVYRILNVQTPPVPPPPPESDLHNIPPPTPLYRNHSMTAHTPVRETFDLPPVPVPNSPPASTASISDASVRTLTPRATLATTFSPKSLPVLMVVTAPFQPTRDDELSVRTGETVRLIKDFEDEWCLVQRVGRPDAEKGVVPRLCLSERPRIIDHRATLSSVSLKIVRPK